ncbi:MAG: peptide chain release factor N(5)-glutamine methyltransferase [Stellaceae bacterium]
MTQEEALADATARLAAAGIETPRHEARLLLALAAATPAAALFRARDGTLPPAAGKRLQALVARRAGHEPYARIAGKREFWSLEFELGPDTLEPRPDSETVIETALALIPDRRAALRIVDFGTGSGALLLALLSELPCADGIGIDRLSGAIRVARRNAAALSLAERARFVVGDWGAALDIEAHLILANPPYIPSADIAKLAPEVAHFDPILALDGGPDGLTAYRQLADDVVRMLRPGGWAVFEVGAGQDESVAAMMGAVGLQKVTKRCDLAGIIRSIAFVKRKNIDKTVKLDVTK